MYTLRSILPFAASLLSALAVCCTIAPQPGTFSPADYVNPFIGASTSTTAAGVYHGLGKTFPGATTPYGMVQVSPNTITGGDNGPGYSYEHTTIEGFAFTQMSGIGWYGDLGNFLVMPTIGDLHTFAGTEDKPEEGYRSRYDKSTEKASAGYYSVFLSDYKIQAEATALPHSGMLRFTFPENEHSYIVVDALDKGSYIKVIPEENKIIGYSTKNSGGVPDNFKNYFVIEFDKPFTYEATFADASLKEGAKEQTSDHVGAVIGFKTKKGEIVHAKVASSFISFDQAAINMKELGNDNFDTLVQKGKDVWNEHLSKIEVEGGDLDQYRTFYSCFYRSLLFPRKFYEINAQGEVVHYSPYNGEVLPGYMFTDTGFWDTFRSLFPFLNLMFPSVNKEMQEGLINTYKESGFFPEWASPGHRGCMVGNNSASILVDAYMKGVKVDDLETLYKGLIHGTENVHPKVSSTGRLGHEYYNKLGYVPYDVKINENAARTLEYAYNDWCIWQIAKQLGRPKKELDLYARRALNYKNLYDKETKLMRGKNENGEFMAPFSPLKWGDAFTEGNSWHYSWSVFHDPQGLIDLMGGKDSFVMMLDSVFAVPPLFDDSYYGGVIHEIREMTVMNMGNYAHGNQPIQHMIYLYNYAGQPWKAQYWLRQVMNKMYTPGPDGYCGDEDNGQTSAWYVFSALGFYPVAPGTTQYVLGAPLFKKATIHFENGNNLVINAPNNSDKNIYIESMTFNGKNYTKNYLDHNDLFKGGVIDFKMGDKPNMNRGINPEDMPYSFSVNEEGINKLSPISVKPSKKKK